MRNLILYFIIIGACLFSSCNLNRKSGGALPVELIQAENIMNENPDSALRILQGMAVPADKEAHATWALFTTQAKYKLFMTQSDSLLNIAFPYFMAKGDAQRRAMVLYYRAALYREENKVEEAQEYYLKAKDEVDKLDDYFLKYLVYAELGHIYARTLPDYGMEYYIKALNYAQNSSIPKPLSISCIISSYIDIARMYSQKKEHQQALTFYKKAVDIAQNNNDYSKQMAALKEMATIYRKNNDFQSALACMQETYQIANSHSIKWSSAKFLTLGRIYAELNQLDSATNNLNRALLSSDIYTKAGVYSSLFHIYKNKGEHKKAISHLEQAWILQDSITKAEKNKALIEMQEKYDQQKVINEKNEAERKGLIILFASIVLIAVIIVCYQWKVLRQKKELEAKREELNSLISRLNENKQTIAKNEARIEELEKTKEDSDEQQKSIEEMQRQNDALGKENKGLQSRIDEYAATMAAKSKELENLHVLSEMNLYLHKRESFLCAELLKKDDFVNKLKKHPKALDAVQWEETIDRTNTIYDNYTLRLRNQIPELTENDIRICCLIKLSFSNVEIANILGISSASVSRQKLRLKERITQKVGPLENNITLDLWLREY